MTTIVNAVTFLAQPVHAMIFIGVISGSLIAFAGVCVYLEKKGII